MQRTQVRRPAGKWGNWRAAAAIGVALAAGWLPAQVATMQTAPPAAACQYVLGFATLADLVGRDTVGDCLENEHVNPANGNTEQRTTNGMLVWRVADGRAIFSNGSTTWVYDPVSGQLDVNAETPGALSDTAAAAQAAVAAAQAAAAQATANAAAQAAAAAAAQATAAAAARPTATPAARTTVPKVVLPPPVLASVNVGGEIVDESTMAIVLTARASNGAQLAGLPLRWTVSFGDGSTGTCANPTPCRLPHTYAAPKIYTAVASAIDPATGKRFDSRPIAIGVGQTPGSLLAGQTLDLADAAAMDAETAGA